MTYQDNASFTALFLAHPVPMWVYELDNYRFMAVNTAAVSHYGYTEAEFLEMTIRDIRPPDERARLSSNLEQPLHLAVAVDCGRLLQFDRDRREEVAQEEDGKR
jgi:PAS domain S-box-containing protein